MATQKERRKIAEQMAEDKARRDKERKEFQERQELEGLKRAFKRLDKKNDSRLDQEELLQELNFLEYKVDKEELNEIIWEIDDDDDNAVDWEEFKSSFYRSRDDKTGYEPRKLYYLTEFMMADKDQSGSIDVEEFINIWYTRYGKEEADAKMTEYFGEDFSGGNIEITFTQFMDIQRQASRKSRRSANAMLPQVKPIQFLDGALL
jgi:calmodulin